MIADALAAEEAPKRPKLRHAQHILDQYAKVCGDGHTEEEPNVEIALPAARAERANSPPKNALSRISRAQTPAIPRPKR